jgi:HK97 family phage prohead protease
MSDDAIFRRFRAIGDSESLQEDGRISLIASTADAVPMGGWREVLMHDEGCIDMAAARSLLVNHDPNQLAGSISAMACDGRTLTSNAEIDADARMGSGVSVRKSVANRSLNGVSIGYAYSRADADYDESTRTVTVRKWRLMEISLTPIPADARAHVRSIPFDLDKTSTVRATPTIPNEPNTLGDSSTVTFTPAAIPAATLKETRMSADINKPNPQGPEAANKIDDGVASEKARASVIQETREVAELARSHGLDPVEYIGQSKAEASLAMLRSLSEKHKTPEPKQAAVTLHVDQADKARDAFAGALAFNAGHRSGEFAEAQRNNPLVGQGFQHAVSRYARLMGLDTQDWTKRDLAYFAVGKPEMMDARFGRSANVTSSMFPNFVFLNAMTKVVAKGFEMGAATSRYQKISRPNSAPDFKAFYVGGLASGNFTQTAEDTAFPELTKTEASYNDTAKMWGGTLSLTVQAIANDDTAQFDRTLGQAGAIADKTIDKRCFQKLLMGTSTSEATSTWTSNTTSGGSLVYTTGDLAAAARGKLSIVRAAFMNKVGLDGNPLGNAPRYLCVPLTREMEAMGIVGGSGPLLTAGVQQPAASLEVVASPWLEFSSLTGYSTTSYYLVADPDAVTGLLVTKVRGYESIQAQPYDAGAVAALNVKLWLPFEVSLFKGANSAGTTIVPGAHQGTT